MSSLQLTSVSLLSLLPHRLVYLPTMDHLKATFAKCKEEKRAALVAYIACGFPTVEETVDILLGLENGGAGA